MGDAGEGLIDQDSRIQERMEELERERAKAHIRDVRNPEAVRMLESLRLARAGRRPVEWDERNDAGSRVASGVYFVSVRVAGQFVTGRVAVVR